jgi:ribonuclease HII
MNKIVSDMVLEKIDYKIFSPTPVVGVDEVGRGCLAGPVVAGAVCLRSDELLSELTDSKLLSEARREILAESIQQHHWYGIGMATVEEIEKINILQASFLAMYRAIQALEKNMQSVAGHIVVDGPYKIPTTISGQVSWMQTPLIKGDLRCAPISAASIVAKVYRDQLMKKMAQEYPEYGFEKHKGYASPTHKASIKKFGPTVVHRKTFKGVSEFC